ncbi:acetylserotonin O-methyltransferase [Aetokthonos hydrillicola Thurmond2011]|uniref:Acetylserotonin O-methyltransferase n=1 Tax=Aetokthonos hydrillicola Thurmond2011 TaxID=2712845 RepID=A0AAP5IFA3_9CYAN|nr:acetylserotonin O-methyltransferase [Aetokthonos hydrillicola]MDR9899842.1 acetylserotonin O-methyltransferase [Aetokthonos hydrillicola Thurmond2011]
MLGTTSASKKLAQMIYGYWQSQCLYVATNLGIPNLLQSGSMTVETIAKETSTKVETLYVVLRALAHLGVFVEKPGRVFAATELSNLLITNAEPSLGHFLMHITEPSMWDAWRELGNSLKTGEVAFERANGKKFYEFFMTENPEYRNLFNNSMTFLTNQAVDSVFEVYDFGQYGTVMDVGGNQGALISHIVKKFGCKGMLFDLPHEVKTAPAFLAKQGLDEDAVQIIAGNALEEIPKGADAIVMKYFLSVFSSQDSIKVLTRCREALPKHGRIILLQTLVPPRGAPVEYPDGTIPALAAVQMMVTNPGGYWRTEQEYKELFYNSGFQLEKIIYTGTSLTVMEFRVNNEL